VTNHRRAKAALYSCGLKKSRASMDAARFVLWRRTRLRIFSFRERTEGDCAVVLTGSRGKPQGSSCRFLRGFFYEGFQRRPGRRARFAAGDGGRRVRRESRRI